MKEACAFLGGSQAGRLRKLAHVEPFSGLITLMLSSAFEKNFDYYCSHHRTLGCRVTHMFGIPMLFLTPIVGLFNKKAASSLFKCGWALQFLGHYVFEHNKPVFLEVKNPMTALSALLFVSGLWYRFFTGTRIAIAQCRDKITQQEDLKLSN